MQKECSAKIVWDLWGERYMNKVKKVLAALLAFTMLTSSFLMLVGCSKKAEEGIPEVISGNRPWFDCTKVKLEVPYSKDEYSQIRVESPIYLDGYIYVLVNAYENYDESKAAFDNDFAYGTIEINKICQFDTNGNFIKDIDLANDRFVVYMYTSISAKDGKICVDCDGVDSKNYYSGKMQLLVDTKTNEIDRMESPVDLSNFVQPSIIGEYKDGDTTIYAFNYFVDYLLSGAFAICKGDKDPVYVYLKDVDNISGDAFVSCFSNDNGNTIFGITHMGKVYKLNVKEAKLEEYSEEVDLSGYIFEKAQDNKYYSSNFKGVCYLNKNFEIEMLLDYNDTNVNVNDMTFSSPLYVTEKEIILAVTKFEMSTTEISIYNFTKASKNPNVGKKVIDVLSMSDTPIYADAEAIVKFNSTNSEYFAMIRYSEISNILEDDIESQKKTAAVSNQLIIDIINGDGPDILLDGFDCDEFNSSDYFVDLNKFIASDSSFDTNKYFDNIWEVSKTKDGALYQIPASFLITGIAAKKSDVGEDCKGFTYESYLRFLDEVCNGTSPIQKSRSEFLNLVISAGYIDFVKDGKVDFNTEEFKALAEFARDNFPDENEYEAQVQLGYGDLSEPQFLVINPSSLAFDFGSVNEPFGMYGFPFSEEKGPVAYIMSSAAISANIDEEKQKACWELVKVMLSDDVQMTIEKEFPVNKNAFQSSVQKGIDSSNDYFNSFLKLGYSEQELISAGIVYISDIDGDIYDMALNVDSLSRSDTALYPIITEEIAAYFAGQKDIDSVISIINDRAQTIYDER